MIKKETYSTPALFFVTIQEKDIICTSDIFVPNDAPDVYEKDPFAQILEN